VGAEKLVFWVSLLPLCERREESEKVLLWTVHEQRMCQRSWSR
jgi:hypothetical protein